MQHPASPSYLGFVEFPLTKRLLSMGYTRDTAQDTRRALSAWLTRQVCVFEDHHGAMWKPFNQAMEVVRPLTYSDLRLDAARNPVRIVRRFIDVMGERRCETYRISGDAAALGVCYMLYSDECRAWLLDAIRANSMPIFLTHAVMLLGCVDAELLRWALPSYGSVNFAGSTSIDIRGLDMLMSMSSQQQQQQSLTPPTPTQTEQRNQVAFVMFARLIFNFVFAQMCSKKNGVTDSAIRVRLVHERTLFHMFCRHLNRSPRITATEVARVVPGMCSDVVAHLRLPQLNELMSATAERVIQTFECFNKEFQPSQTRSNSHQRVLATTTSPTRTPKSAADQIVALWCSDRVAYDVFLRCRFASGMYHGHLDPLWRGVCNTPREVRVSIGTIQLHTIGSSVAELTRFADTSGLHRMFTFIKSNFEHPSTAVIAEISGCSQYELFQTLARVVPAQDAGFWSSLVSDTCVIDLGASNVDGAGVLVVCSDAVFTRLETMLVVAATVRTKASTAPPSCLESFSVSYHVARALCASSSGIVSSAAAATNTPQVNPMEAALWRTVVSWAKPSVLSDTATASVDWNRLTWLVHRYCGMVAQHYASRSQQELQAFFESKSRSKLQFLLVAHSSGLIEAGFKTPAHREYALKFAQVVVAQKSEAWCRAHGLTAFLNASVDGMRDLVSDANLVTDFLYVALLPDEELKPVYENTPGSDRLRMLSTILSLNNADVLDDQNKVAVPYGDHHRLQQMTLCATLPSTPTSVSRTLSGLGSSSSSSSSSFAFGGSQLGDDDIKSFGVCRPVRLECRDSSMSSVEDAIRTQVVGVTHQQQTTRQSDIEHLVMLDVLLTWENIFRQRTVDATRIGGVATACVSVHNAIENRQWSRFVDRCMYDIPYGISSSGLLFSRSQVPITQFVNRKVIFSDDIRAKLLCVVDSPWRKIPGFAAWWDMQDLESAFSRRHLPPALLPRVQRSRSLDATPPAAATAVATPYSPVYSPVTPLVHRRIGEYSPTAHKPSGALEFDLYNEDDEDEDDTLAGKDYGSDSDDPETADRHMLHDMLGFNQYGSMATSKR